MPKNTKTIRVNLSKSRRDLLEIKGKDVGHKDNDPLNNDPKNLRLEDPGENRREPRMRDNPVEEGYDPNVHQEGTPEATARATAMMFPNEELDEVLNIKQRRDRGISARKNKTKMAMGRRKAANKIASTDKLKKRAQRQARTQMALKIAKDGPKKDMTPARKAEIEKRLDKMRPRINNIAKRMMKDVRKAEIARKRGK